MSRTLVLSPESEIRIEMDPGRYSIFMGSRMSLEAEGLVPEGFEWPVGSKACIWEEGLFKCNIRRYPSVSSIKKSVWSTQDHWRLCMFISNQPNNHWLQLSIAEKTRELAHAVWRLSPAGERQCERWCAAREDKDYCEFMERVLPPRRTRAKRATTPRVEA